MKHLVNIRRVKEYQIEVDAASFWEAEMEAKDVLFMMTVEQLELAVYDKFEHTKFILAESGAQAHYDEYGNEKWSSMEYKNAKMGNKN